MKTKLSMDADIKKMQIKSKDVIFTIRDDNDVKFGEIRISQGGIVWRGRSEQWGRKIGWKRFNDLMDDEGYRREKRKRRSVRL